MKPIALQLYSVREDLEKDFVGTLQKVKKLGYDGVEFAGLYNHSPEEINKTLKELGLIALSAHVPFEELTQDTEKVLNDYKTIGCTYVAIPYLTEEYRPSGEKFDEVIEQAKKIGSIAKKLGITLLYHNHDFEFEKIDNKYALDILYSEVDSSLLQCEIDTCWVNVAGEKPCDYLSKYENRIPVVHLKDFSYKDDDNKTIEFRPLGKGVQDFKSIVETSEKMDTEWFVVEQDSPSLGLTALECAKESINYIKNI